MMPEKMEELLLEIKDEIGQINVELGKINTKLDADYLAIHGNGKPGLLSQVSNLSERLVKLEEKDRHNGNMWIVIGFIVNALISLAALYVNYKR